MSYDSYIETYVEFVEIGLHINDIHDNETSVKFVHIVWT